MIASIALPSSASCEDFLNIIKTVNKMAQLGLEFCGSDSSALLSCLTERSKSYFTSMHIEAMQVLNLMVESESWEVVNINLKDVGGVLGILKKSVIVSSRRKSKTAKRKNTDSILVSFAKYGNPFTSETEVEKEDVVKSKLRLEPVDEEEEEEEERGGGGDGEICNGLKNKNKNKNKNGNENDNTKNGDGKEGDMKLDKNNDDNEEEEVEDEVEEEIEIGFGSSTTDRFNLIAFDRFMSPDSNELLHTPSTSTSTSTDIVTQTSLNGLARYTGRYLQLMFLLPLTAPDIFTALCSLFDYYLCAVYTGFVCVEKQTILKRHKLSRTAASAPDKSHETEVSMCVVLCWVGLSCVVLCCDVMCCVMLCYAMSCHVMSCYVMLCHVVLCHVML